MRSRLVAAVVGVVVLALVASGCGGSDDGDVDAYCAFVNETGTGTSLQADDLDRLLEVAPPEVRDEVRELRNLTVDVNQITEIDQLFAAAFNPDAQAAREAFNDHAVEVCGYEGEAIAREATTASATTLATVRRYVNDNFGNTDWSDKVTFVIDQATDGQILDITVRFIIDPRGDEAMEACTALGIWLYEVRNGEGQVTVTQDDVVLAQRLGRDAGCEVPEG